MAPYGRSPTRPPELDWLGGPDRLDELLAESDFVLIACAMNSSRPILTQWWPFPWLRQKAFVSSVFESVDGPPVLT